MSDTTLSPRLRHLLIQENRKTGELYMPFNANSTSGAPSPSFATNAGDSTLPAMSSSSRTLPPPIPIVPKNEHRQSVGLFSLLNDLNVSSPPSTASSSQSADPRIESIPRTSPPIRATPTYSAPLPEASEPGRPYFAPRGYRHSVAPPQSPHRPDLSRRHSVHPYHHSNQPDGAHAGRPDGQPMVEYTPLSGSRAPISRTTKACNACRGRKVRCDAGGLPNGETGTCSRCRESGVECVYTGVQRKRGPCPGSIRPPTSAGNLRTRRLSSQRSSFASTGPTTPPEEAVQAWSSRSSYGMPHSPTYAYKSHSAPYQPHASQHSPHHPYLHYPHQAVMSDPPVNSSQWSSQNPAARGDFAIDISSRPNSATQKEFSHPPSRHPSVLSWPQMEPATEVDEPIRIDEGQEERTMFERNYAMRPSSKASPDDRSTLVGPGGEKRMMAPLPPLSVAIGLRGSYYTQ